MRFTDAASGTGPYLIYARKEAVMKLRHYETFYLLHPDLNEEGRTAISEKLQQTITDRGGQIARIDPWPLRKLAYRVQKQTQGYYVLMEYGAPASAVSEITRELRLDERVLKFITKKNDDAFDLEAILAAARPAASEGVAEGPRGFVESSDTAEGEEEEE
jgi:small subunit ribosomal protein S6